jgi:hypothetical protein
MQIKCGRVASVFYLMSESDEESNLAFLPFAVVVGDEKWSGCSHFIPF